MEKKLKISILTDSSSWMNTYNKILMDSLKEVGCEVSLISSKHDIREGDIAFFLSCFDIIGKEYLQKNNHNIVVHASNLPQGKGWSPMTWQILEGKNEIPLSLFEATEKVDSGDIYLRDKIILKGTELISEWQEIMGKKIVDMCLHFVEDYPNIITKKIKQEGVETFYPQRTPKNSQLDINKTIKDQFNLLRVVDNEKYPAFFEINGKVYLLKIYERKDEE